MPSALVALANITLSGSQANVTFSSISQAYRDLLLVVTPTSASTEELALRINGDTSGSYFYAQFRGDGSSVSAYYGYISSYMTLGGVTYSQTSAIMNSQISFMDYSATNKQKMLLVRSNNASYGVEALAGRWANNSAITSIQVYGRFGVNFTAGTTMALYGIASA